MPAALNLVGQTFGRLTVLSRHGQTEGGQTTYLCNCECGNTTVGRTGCLRNGHKRSCGCLSPARKGKGPSHSRFKHGLSYKSHPENRRYQRECYDRFKYGLEPHQKEAMLRSQHGGCAICGYQFGQSLGDMVVDHDHSSGMVRGLLCDLCNRGLGYYKDKPDLLMRAAEYLLRTKQTNAR